MDYNNLNDTALRELLTRYMNCETDLEEEALLRRYFNENEAIAEDLKPYRSMFVFYKQQQSVQSEQTAKFPAATASIPLQPKRRWMLFSAAASVALLIAFSWAMGLFSPAPSNNPTADSYSEAEKKALQKQILADTKAALMLVSGKLNKGKKKLKKKQ